MVNGVVHEGYFIWSVPYMRPHNIGVDPKTGEYNVNALKVNHADYIKLDPNPKRDAMAAEELELVKQFDMQIQTGNGFKQKYGQFNYSLCHADSLIKFARNERGELIPL